jgi:hypothetical protein
MDSKSDLWVMQEGSLACAVALPVFAESHCLLSKHCRFGRLLSFLLYASTCDFLYQG